MPVQIVHIPPPVPQAVEAIPDWHIVPSQQPPLHVSPPVQLLVHLPALQASPDGQSVALAQPQVPPERHTVPLELPVQSTHAVDDPQAVVEVPGMQVPIAPPQQKPAPQAPPSQLAVQAPPEHVGVSPPHEMHAAPAEPHDVSLVPVTHFVPLQQPPLQVRPPTQLAEQSPVVGSQASPLGQLVDVHGTWVSCLESGCETTSAALSRVESMVTSLPPSEQEPTHAPSSSREHAAKELAVAAKNRASPNKSRAFQNPRIHSAYQQERWSAERPHTLSYLGEPRAAW
jgi:hypothetical protein